MGDKTNAAAPSPGNAFGGNSGPQAAGRQYESMVILGPNGFGKSALADELSGYYRARGGREWVVDPCGNWLQHPGRIRYKTKAELDAQLRALMANENGYCPAGPGRIIDDADLYYRHPTDERMEIIVGHRHHQKDIIVIARRPQGIHKDFFQIASTWALFHQQQVYAREYLAAELEDSRIVRAIPREKFRYLYIHRATGKMAVYSTKPRAMLTASDIR